MIAAALAVVLCGACNPDPGGRCDSQPDCSHGTICNVQLHLCLAPGSACTPACDGGTCSNGVCVSGSQPTVRLSVAQNALLSPSRNLVEVAISSDPSVVLGQLVLSVSELDGGLFDGGPLAGAVVTVASADAGVSLIFAPGAQAPGNLVATLNYSSMDAGGTVSSATVPVRVDAVPPSISVAIRTANDEVSGWFPRTLDGGISVDATLDDTALGSGPDGGTLTVLGCPANIADAGGCEFNGTPLGIADGGSRKYRFVFPRTLATAGAQGPLSFTIDGVDNGGNHADQGGSVLIDDAAPVTDSQVGIVNTDAGTIGEDGQLWFPAGTLGVDVEVDLAAADTGVGLDPATFLLTLASSDIDVGQSAKVGGFLPGDGKVHFKIPTGRTSKREGPLAFTITMADKVGNAIAPVQGQILVDDAAPTVTLANPDYSDATISPVRSAVCAANVQCGRGSPTAPDHALRDDLVTATFTAVDCGVGIDLGALPSCAIFYDVSQINSADFTVTSVATGATTAGNCANGSTNPKHVYTCQFALASTGPLLPESASGTAPLYMLQVAYDSIGGEGFSPAPNPDGGPGVVQVSRWRWKAPLDGHPTGAPALLPLALGVSPTHPRMLVVPVDGKATPASPDGLEVFEDDGNLTEIPLTPDDGGTFDHATGDVAIGASRTVWIAGTPFSCQGGLASCTNVWAARVGAAPVACSTFEVGVIDSLALRNAPDGGVEIAVAGVLDGGLGTEIATSFRTASTTALSCSRVDGTSRIGVAGATGLSLAGGNLFVADEQGFFSLGLDSAGRMSGGGNQVPFVPASSDTLIALPAAASVLVGPDGGSSPYFNAEDSLASPTAWALREAVASGNLSSAGGGTGAGPSLGCNGNCWAAAPAPWNAVATTAPVLHSPVFDAKGLYTVDNIGTLQLSEFTTASSVPISSLPAVTLGGGAQPQLVSPPVLFAGASAGSSALLVQSNGLVRLASLIASTSPGGAPLLSPASVLTVGAFTQSTPPTPVIDVRGTGSVAYIVDGSGACSAGSATTSCSWVWALQLDALPVTASTTVWPRPQHDSCNSRQAEGSCP